MFVVMQKPLYSNEEPNAFALSREMTVSERSRDLITGGLFLW
jgi:hypothetical protein